jgi:hypothetical protein
MDIETLRQFFLWCTIFGGGMLIVSSLVCTFAREWVYRMHSRWFPMPKETFNVVIYCFVGLFKILVILFGLIPYLALVVIGGN